MPSSGSSFSPGLDHGLFVVYLIRCNWIDSHNQFFTVMVKIMKHQANCIFGLAYVNQLISKTCSAENSNQSSSCGRDNVKKTLMSLA